MVIEILGKGCANCKRLEENVKKALAETGKTAEIKHITDINKIAEYGVLMTPALVIDGEVKSSGKVLEPDAIKLLLA